MWVYMYIRTVDSELTISLELVMQGLIMRLGRGGTDRTRLNHTALHWSLCRSVVLAWSSQWSQSLHGGYVMHGSSHTSLTVSPTQKSVDQRGGFLLVCTSRNSKPSGSLHFFKSN